MENVPNMIEIEQLLSAFGRVTLLSDVQKRDSSKRMTQSYTISIPKKTHKIEVIQYHDGTFDVGTNEIPMRTEAVTNDKWFKFIQNSNIPTSISLYRYDFNKTKFKLSLLPKQANSLEQAIENIEMLLKLLKQLEDSSLIEEESSNKGDRLRLVLFDLHQQYILLCREVFMYEAVGSYSHELKEQKRRQARYYHKISNGMHNLLDCYVRSDRWLILELKELQDTLSRALNDQTTWSHVSCTYNCLTTMTDSVNKVIETLNDMLTQESEEKNA